LHPANQDCLAAQTIVIARRAIPQAIAAFDPLLVASHRCAPASLLGAATLFATLDRMVFRVVF
jgi:hypothetical protein